MMVLVNFLFVVDSVKKLNLVGFSCSPLSLHYNWAILNDTFSSFCSLLMKKLKRFVKF
jgi:hypothetical protein